MAEGRERNGGQPEAGPEMGPGAGAGFKTVEHTADLAIRVWAPDLDRFFLQAAAGLTSIITDVSKVRPQREVPFEITGSQAGTVSWPSVRYQFCLPLTRNILNFSPIHQQIKRQL